MGQQHSPAAEPLHAEGRQRLTFAVAGLQEIQILLPLVAGDLRGRRRKDGKSETPQGYPFVGNSPKLTKLGVRFIGERGGGVDNRKGEMNCTVPCRTRSSGPG